MAPSALAFPPAGPLWNLNRLINGGFTFFQRQTAATLTTYSSIGGRVYGADRWALSNETASVQAARVDTIAAVAAGLNDQYYGRYVKITNAGKIQLSHTLEAPVGAPLRARVVRVQATMRFSVAASMTMSLGLAQLTSAGVTDTVPSLAGTFVTAFGAAGVDPTLGANLAYIAPIAGTAENGTLVANGVQCGLTAVFVRYGASFLVPSDCKNLIVLLWSNQQLAVNDEFHVGQVGLYDGVQAVDWMPDIIGLVQQEIARYYQKTFNLGTGPASGVGVSSAAVNIPCPVAGAVGIAGWEWRVPVPMRSLPNLVSFNPFGAGAEARDVTAAADCTGTALANNGTNVLIATTPPVGALVGDRLALHITADAEL